jgi:hypothetical protein
MGATIENLTEKPLWLRLNSGTSLSIMPRTKREVPEREVRGNAKLARLHEERVIRTTYDAAEDAKAAEAKPAAKAKEAKKKAAEAKPAREAAEAAEPEAVEDDKREDRLADRRDP